jgi:hypothetical protein
MKLPFIAACICFGLIIPSCFAQMPCIPFSSSFSLLPKAASYKVTVTFNATTLPPAAFLSGHPYSGEEISQQKRTLADGTTLTRSEPSNFIYRDSAGRTRNERSLSPSINGKPLDVPMIPQIFDPIAGYCYCLDMVNRVAHRVILPKPIKTINPGERLVFPMSTSFRPGENFNPRDLIQTREDLGTKTIEGISAKGSRTTTTYPAGAVGNDTPVKSTTEIWMSPELNATVLSKTSDPVSGENMYALINIKTTEPEPKLFQIPSNFMVVDEGSLYTIVYTENDKINATP